MNKLAIVDGDSLVYQSSKESLQESIVNIDEKINNIFEKTEATHYLIFISNSPYFRHKIDPLYKSGRTKHISPLKWLKTLKKYLVEGWNAQSMDLVEADDLVSYWYNKQFIYYELLEGGVQKGVSVEGVLLKDGLQVTESIDKVVCSPDKDLLKSIVGKHFNYTYKLEDKDNPNSVIKGWWVETDGAFAYIDFWKSMVCGDATDNIKGIEGSGEAAFNKILKVCQDSLIPIEDMVFTTYKKKYGVSQGIYEFQKNYRLLHLLENDEGFMREVGELPTFPVITEVPTKQEVKELDDLKF